MPVAGWWEGDDVLQEVGVIYIVRVVPFSSEIKLSLFLTVLRSSRSHFSWSEASSLLNSAFIISSARAFRDTCSA